MTWKSYISNKWIMEFIYMQKKYNEKLPKKYKDAIVINVR